MIADPEEGTIDYFAEILTLVSKITIKLRITNESFSNLGSSLKHLASLLRFIQTNGGRRGEVLSQCTYRKNGRNKDSVSAEETLVLVFKSQFVFRC